MLARAQKAGVGCIITIGFDLETSMGAISLAEQYDFVYATVGMHPHDAKLLDDGITTKFRKLAQHPKVVALGEMGLDYYRNLSPRSIQRKAFEVQLQLAQELNLPIIVHDRDAHEDIMKILRRYVRGKGEDRENGGGKENRLGVLHCFSGDIDMAKEAIDLGFYISIAGPVTYPKSLSLQRVAREVPLDSLFFETDCPWLAPQFRRGKRNEPAYVKVIAEKIAQFRNASVKTIADATTANVKNLFGI